MRSTLKVIFLLVLNFSIFADGKFPRALKIGHIPFAPFITNNKEGKLEGPIKDYIEKLFSEHELIWIDIPLKRVTRALDSGQIDLFATYFKTTERQKEVSYPDKYYFALIPSICALNAPLTENPDLLINEKFNRVLAVSGTKRIGNITDNPRTQMIEVVVDNFLSKSAQMLISKKADFVYFAGFTEVEADLKKIDKEIKCIKLKKYPQELYIVAKLNSPLKEIIDQKIKKFGKMKF